MREYSQQHRQLQETLLKYVRREKIPLAEVARRASLVPNTVQEWFAEGERAIAIPVEKLQGLEDALRIPLDERQTLPKNFGKEYLKVVEVRLGEDYDRISATLRTYGLPEKNQSRLALGSSVDQVLAYFYRNSGKMHKQIAQETGRQRQSVGTILKGRIGKCSVFDLRAIEDSIGVPITHRLTAPRSFADIYRDLLKGHYPEGPIGAPGPKPLEAAATSLSRAPVDASYGIIPYSIVQSLSPEQKAELANLYLLSLYELTHSVSTSRDPQAIAQFKKRLNTALVMDSGGMIISFLGDSEKIQRFLAFNQPRKPADFESGRKKK